MIYFVLILILIGIIGVSTGTILFMRRAYNQTFKADVGGRIIEAECAFKYLKLFIDGELKDKFDGMQLYCAKLTADTDFGKVKVNISYTMTAYRCAMFVNDAEVPFEIIDRNKIKKNKGAVLEYFTLDDSPRLAGAPSGEPELRGGPAAGNALTGKTFEKEMIRPDEKPEEPYEVNADEIKAELSQPEPKKKAVKTPADKSAVKKTTGTRKKNTNSV